MQSPLDSPLSGFRSPFGYGRRLGGALAAYAVATFTPKLVFDFETETYATGGAVSTFDDSINYTGDSLKTMVDSDGLWKWAPHNLLTYSEDLTNAWSTINDATIINFNTFEFTTNPNDTLESAAAYVAAGEYTIEIEFWSETDAGESIRFGFASDNSRNLFSPGIVLQSTPTKYTLQKTEVNSTILNIRTQNNIDSLAKTVKVRNARIYRSDLGGMANNPDRGDSYVPTTDSRVYLPRRGHHVYDGTSYVNEGLLVESEARTNLITYSEDFTDASWGKIKTDTLAIDATGPDGETSAVTLVDAGSGGQGQVFIGKDLTVDTNTAYTFSVFAKADQLTFLVLHTTQFTTPSNNARVFFDLSSGTVSYEEEITGQIEDVGDGWYRCSTTFTTDATDTDGTLRIGVSDANGDVKRNYFLDLDGTSSILIFGAQFE